MSAPVVNVDFVARRSRVTLAGALLLLLGASAAAGSYAEYHLMQEKQRNHNSLYRQPEPPAPDNQPLAA